MDLRSLRFFLAVAEERNFTRAAERLHMAQPPLTRQIRALEQRLGCALFERTSKGAELTEAGRTLLAEAPNLLTLAQREADAAIKRTGLQRLTETPEGFWGKSRLP